MDVHIDEVTSRLEVADSQTFLDPRILERIVRLCIQGIQEEQERQKKIQSERELRPNVSGH